MALVFGATTTQDQAIVVAVDGDLRYRDRSDDRWYSISEPVLKHCLQQRGQPTLTSLSETSLERAQFVDRQENNPTTNSQP
ncbi:hypothetical protein BBD46_19790 [Natrialba sp. SSL1]|nr:hypothetical protein BBD46_19790 [Natrialba sp. SSL1]